MKKNLLKKFYAFIVTAMMFSVSANAQIVYTNVIPDSTMSCDVTGLFCLQNYYLDLNNDANNDFTLSVFTTNFGPNKEVFASPLNGNALQDTLVNYFGNSYNAPIPLKLNAVIDSNLLLQQSWQTSGNHYLRKEYSSSPGIWNNLSDYYLGLRLLQSGQTYFGWVRLRVNTASLIVTLIIKDYAYNSIPNQPILAGQTTATGVIENSFASSINLFPNPTNNHLTITLPNNNKKIEVTITDITGKIIYSATASETQKVEVNTNDFKAGIYAVQIQSADFIESRKLVIQK